jgi:N,N'-diacetyllegionaminate synthase
MIIAEAGINHNGSIKIAKELIDKAASIRADAIKFQTFWDIEEFKDYEFTLQEWFNLKKYCDEKRIMFLTTADTFDVIDTVDILVPIHKSPSSKLNDRLYLEKLASKNKQILLSTGSLTNEDGMATLDEIRKSLYWLPKNNIVLLHCVSKYPCKDPHYERVDLFKNEFGCSIGISDHSKSTKPPKGLEVYEKHFMLEGLECPDSNVSLTPSEFKEMIEWLRE